MSGNRGGDTTKLSGKHGLSGIQSQTYQPRMMWIKLSRHIHKDSPVIFT